MRKTLLIIFLLSLIVLAGALEFTLDGEARTRGVMYYADRSDAAGAHVDSKLWLGANLHMDPNLKLRINLQLGDVVWGLTPDDQPGGGISAGIPVTAYELYVDYRIKAIKSNLRVGQQYWADHRSLMLDDSFSGITLSSGDLLGLQTTLGWIKQVEGSRYEAGDDVDTFLLSLQDQAWGLQAFYTINAASSPSKYRGTDILTALPYLAVPLGPVNADITGIAQYDFAARDLDYGAAARVSTAFQPGEIGIDALFYANENPGLNHSLSQYYRNKLYIFGIGQHFDGWVGWDPVDWYWGESAAPGIYLSTVGYARLKLAQNLDLFAAGGLIHQTGWEANGGLELNLGKLQLAAYGAYGKRDGHDKASHLIGSTLKASFY